MKKKRSVLFDNEIRLLMHKLLPRKRKGVELLLQNPIVFSRQTGIPTPLEYLRTHFDDYDFFTYRQIMEIINWADNILDDIRHIGTPAVQKKSDTAYKQGSYIVSDLKPSNVVYSKGKCFVIDCFAQNIFDFDNNFYINSKNDLDSLSGYDFFEIKNFQIYKNGTLFLREGDFITANNKTVSRIRSIDGSSRILTTNYSASFPPFNSSVLIDCLSMYRKMDIFANEIAILKLKFGK